MKMPLEVSPGVRGLIYLKMLLRGEKHGRIISSGRKFSKGLSRFALAFGSCEG